MTRNDTFIIIAFIYTAHIIPGSEGVIANHCCTIACSDEHSAVRILRSKRPKLLELRLPFMSQGLVLRLMEPLGAEQATLYRKLIDGSYDKPFLVEDDSETMLCFGLDGSVQSAMRRADPDALVSLYTSKMMAFLLLCPRPQHIVIAGLGGGSLVKYCYRHLPVTRITALEANPYVLALRDEFRIPKDDHRFAVVSGDAQEYFDGCRRPADVALIDLYDRDGVASFVRKSQFLDRVRAHLSDSGVAILNFAGSSSMCRSHIAAVRRVFGNPVIAVRLKDDGNTVVLAFRRMPRMDDLSAIDQRAADIWRRLRLEFPTFVQALTRLRHNLSAAAGATSIALPSH